MSKLTAAAFSVLLLSNPVARAQDGCKYDEQAMLNLDEEAFDQDLSGGGGGWRAISRIPGCGLAAADLLAAYQTKHSRFNSLLAWHEGQLRADAGQYERAIPLLERVRKPADQSGDGWNYYVDASVAFLRHDKSRLLEARSRLAAVTFPEARGMPPLKDGIIELPTQPGQPPMRFRWPPNIDVVDGLIACFDKPYWEAYVPPCRPAAP